MGPVVGRHCPGDPTGQDHVDGLMAEQRPAGVELLAEREDNGAPAYQKASFSRPMTGPVSSGHVSTSHDLHGTALLHSQLQAAESLKFKDFFSASWKTQTSPYLFFTRRVKSVSSCSPRVGLRT